MARLAAFGLSADPPDGWDGEIYRRDDASVGRAVSALVGAGEVVMPILHLANFPLPAGRGDYGGGAVELMGRGGVFVSLLEHPAHEGQTALFAGKGTPWPLRGGDFDPQQMQRTIGGQAGCQRFFTDNGRAFCLYVAIGSYGSRNVLVREVNRALATIDLG
jgi:hypothetical protein